MKHSINKIIKPFGNFKFEKSQNHWFGTVNNIVERNNVELTIEVDCLEQNLDGKISIIKQFVNDIDSIMAKIYEFIYERYSTETNIKLAELEQMYFLTVIELKKDEETWWIVLEPSDIIENIYNHFVRLTLSDKEIVWSNLT